MGVWFRKHEVYEKARETMINNDPAIKVLMCYVEKIMKKHPTSYSLIQRIWYSIEDT